MSDSPIQFKGVNGDLMLSLDWGEPFEQLIDHLEAQLKSSDGFFRGSKVILEIGPRLLTLADLDALRDILARFGMTFHALCGMGPDEKIKPASLATLLAPRIPDSSRDSESDQISHAEKVLDATTAEVFPTASRGRAGARLPRTSVKIQPGDAHAPAKTLLVKRTLRSGQVINYAGNIILIGDINPGAEVVAGHDILIWGSLRGTASAGAAGDPLASIFALHMAPSQLRIGDHITRSPRENLLAAEGHDALPEVAKIENGTIVVEAWPTNKKSIPLKMNLRSSSAEAADKPSRE